MLKNTTARGSRSTKKPASNDSMDEPEMKKTIYTLFTESQHHISSHRKNVHQLRQLHLQWCQGGDAEREEAFFLTFLQCLNVILAVKKNEEVVGKMMRFVVGFVVFSAEKDEEVSTAGSSVSSRFIENLMLYALEGIDAKEKTVRTRLCQLIVACVNSIDELSDHVWEAFRAKMIERLFDKEAAVRVHAVHAMARLQALPIGADDEGGLQVIDIFMDLLQHDPSVEVRKAVLQQIDVTDKSLPVILARKRDVDARIRKAFYATKLAEVDIRALSIQQRDQVLRTGLTDRDSSVKQACIDMIFTNWIHDTNSNLIEFLNCLDVMSNTKMSESALECFFAMNPGLFDAFNAQYLENLTVETAFILRVFSQYRAKKDGAEAVQEMLPELVQMSMYIRRAYESLLTCEEAARPEIEFILHELLLTCRHLDYSDEVGRRVLVDSLLELLTNLELGETIFTEALQLLVLQSPSRMEFFDIASGLISDFQDVFAVDIAKSLEALTIGDEGVSEEVRIMANLRCLEIVKECLCFEGLHIEEEPLLAQALTEIVIPAVNSPFAAVQASGLLCLGLGCTLSKDLATEYISLFFDFVRLGQDETALVALRTIFDLVFLYGLAAFETEGLLDLLTASLYDPRNSVQVVASEGFAKLLLHGIVADNGILEGLLHLHYHSASDDEPRLRQCLAYFFPAFAHSRPSNQIALASVSIPFLRTFKGSPRGLSFLDVANQLAHLTDPANLINEQVHLGEENPHGVLAMDCLWAMIEDPLGLQTKAFLGLLARLRLDSLPKTTIKKLVYLTAQLAKLLAGEKILLASVKKVLSGLVEIDDVEVTIDPEELAVIKARLAPFVRADTLAIPSAMAKAKTAMKKPSLDICDGEISNILEDLDDILQE